MGGEGECLQTNKSEHVIVRLHGDPLSTDWLTRIHHQKHYLPAPSLAHGNWYSTFWHNYCQRDTKIVYRLQFKSSTVQKATSSMSLIFQWIHWKQNKEKSTTVIGLGIAKQECIPVGCVLPAYWPYPSMHCAGGCLPLGGVYPWRCLPRGVSAHWGCLPRGCLPGGCLPKGVSAQGGCLPLVWGVCIPACNGADTPPVDRQTPVKT